MKMTQLLLSEDNLDILTDHGNPTGIQLVPGRKDLLSSMYLCLFKQCEKVFKNKYGLII
jgi:hypothetical protein